MTLVAYSCLCLFSSRPTSQFALVSFHSCPLWRQRKFVETILVSTISLTLLSEAIEEVKERIITALWVPVQCLLYSRHVWFTQTEQINNHKGWESPAPSWRDSFHNIWIISSCRNGCGKKAFNHTKDSAVLTPGWPKGL